MPAEQEQAVLDRIVQDIRQRGNQQTAGDIGFWYLLQALAQQGRSDVIYDMIARTDMGSYGFIVRNGWTSMPEAWDADTGASMNHCMLGHIQEWFLGWVARHPAGHRLARIRRRSSSIRTRWAVSRWARAQLRFHPRHDPLRLEEVGRGLHAQSDDPARHVRHRVHPGRPRGGL